MCFNFHLPLDIVKLIQLKEPLPFLFKIHKLILVHYFSAIEFTTLVLNLRLSYVVDINIILIKDLGLFQSLVFAKVSIFFDHFIEVVIRIGAFEPRSVNRKIISLLNRLLLLV